MHADKLYIFKVFFFASVPTLSYVRKPHVLKLNTV